MKHSWWRQRLYKEAQNASSLSSAVKFDDKFLYKIIISGEKKSFLKYRKCIYIWRSRRIKEEEKGGQTWCGYNLKSLIPLVSMF